MVYRVPFIPASVAENHIMLKTMSVVVLLITGFFAVPVFVLMQVHMKNFCYNRTTNERFGGRRYGKKQEDESAESSEYSATTSLLAEDIVKDMGEPDDYTEEKFTTFKNCLAMCCPKKIPQQKLIFDELLQNRQNRHAESIANAIDMSEFADINNRKSIASRRSTRERSASTKDYGLFLDPYDNQGEEKRYSIGRSGISNSQHEKDKNHRLSNRAQSIKDKKSDFDINASSNLNDASMGVTIDNGTFENQESNETTIAFIRSSTEDVFIQQENKQIYSAPADTNDLNNAYYDKNEDSRPEFQLDYMPN